MRSNVYTLDSSRLVYFFSCTHNVISALKMVSSCNIKAHWLLCTAVIMSKISVAAHHNIASAALTLQIKAVLQIWACSPFLSSMLLLQHPPPFILPPSLPLFLSPCLPALLTLFFLLCHCSSAWRWADAGVVRGNTPRAQHLRKHANLPFLLFQPF